MSLENISEYVPTTFSSDTTNIVLKHYTRNQLYGLRIATLLLSIVGLVGNLLVVLVILSRRRWRFANSMFVLNIAIANLFICAFTLPLMTRALFEIDWTPEKQFCQLSGFIDNTAFACSAWSLALGSIERFFLVVFPMKHRRVMKYQRAIILSLATWVCSVFLSILPIIGWNQYKYSPLTFTCAIEPGGQGIHSYYFLVYLTFVLPGPLIISTVSYSYILFYLRSELWKTPKRRSKNLKVVLPMILISVAFLLCFMPTVVIAFDIRVNPGPPKLQMVEYFIINLLLIGNSAMNPIIFTMCSPKFRDSVTVVVGILLERVVLVVLYLYYLIYYTLLQIADVVEDSCLSGYIKCLGVVEKCLTCFSSPGKEYDSLEETNVKVRSGVGHVGGGHVGGITRQISSSTMERVTAYSQRDDGRRKASALRCDDLFCGCHREGAASCLLEASQSQDPPGGLEAVKGRPNDKTNEKTDETII